MMLRPAPVAQLDRVTVSEAVGCGFDPRRVQNFFKRVILVLRKQDDSLL